MRIVTINCSGIREVRLGNQIVETGIFKAPVSGKVTVHKLGLEGDRQADLSVHGGADKAVYSYDLLDYRWWAQELGKELPPGAFGENLTTEGLLDRDVSVGDILRAGSVILQATQPRLPCYKLGIKFRDELMPKRFVGAQRWGIYFRVLQEGKLEAGDSLEWVERNPQQVRVSDLARIALGYDVEGELIGRALRIDSLVPAFRAHLMELYDDGVATKQK